MRENWEQAFKLTLAHEGGYVNHPKDPGGRTNLGVTQRAWETYIGSPVTESDMRRLTPEVVKPFYKRLYWDRIRGDELPSGVDFAAYDYAVNSGVFRASKALQEIAGVPTDGIVGRITVEALRHCDAAEVVDALCMIRLSFLKGLSTWKTFGKGWDIRVAQVEKQASQLIG